MRKYKTSFISHTGFCLNLHFHENSPSIIFVEKNMRTIYIHDESVTKNYCHKTKTVKIIWNPCTAINLHAWGNSLAQEINCHNARIIQRDRWAWLEFCLPASSWIRKRFTVILKLNKRSYLALTALKFCPYNMTSIK